MFEKILIANRGEIALRVLRACHDLGVPAVVAYSEADRDSLPVRLADQAVCIGPPPAAKSYNHIPSIISAALATGCDAIHPGYGFLAENPLLGEIARECNITFIGPEPTTIEQLGDKAVARQIARKSGVPIIPGTPEPLGATVELRDLSALVGYPMLLKAAGGGGGRGMRVVTDERELMRQLPLAQAEARAAFGNAAVYAERYLERPRHIEVQILGDKHGKILVLGERECSIQRRHQKLLEEAPAPNLPSRVRSGLHKAAARLAKVMDYHGVGTFEFLLAPDGEFYFIEANTRIQVEHPVTEMTTGYDLVVWQIRVAAGEHLTIEQRNTEPRGHAIECRVNAEDATRGFAPSTGLIDGYLAPGGPGVRVDSHLYTGYTVPPDYDSLLGKIIVWGETREAAISRMRRALSETVISGVETTVPFHLRLLRHPQFREGVVHTRFVEEVLAAGVLVEDYDPLRLAPAVGDDG
jgi:acetyl-CoA carboxylase biotin carboxylase subunit